MHSSQTSRHSYDRHKTGAQLSDRRVFPCCHSCCPFALETGEAVSIAYDVASGGDSYLRFLDSAFLDDLLDDILLDMSTKLVVEG